MRFSERPTDVVESSMFVLLNIISSVLIAEAVDSVAVNGEM
jgi:hypothetical protein